MNVVSKNIHKEVDRGLRNQYLAMKAFQVEAIPKDLRYFAADIIAGQYKGNHISGLACACQCFMNARLIHMDRNNMTAEKVLIGDFFAAMVPGFDLPDNANEILSRLASFIEAEAQLINQAGSEIVDLVKFERLFREVAEVAHE